MENKLNSFVLFKNKQKTTDKHPDYNGSIVLADGEHWLSCWVNKSDKGVSYMKGSIGALKEDKPKQQPQANNDFDDDQNFPF